MSHQQPTLGDYLAAWDRRRQARQAALWLPRGVLAGLSVAGLLVLASRLRPSLTPLQLTGVVLVVVVAGILIAVGIAFLTRRSVLEQARYADRELGLKERATTAVQIESGVIRTTPALARQQMDDALASAGTIDPHDALPVRFRRGELLAAVALLLLMLAVIWLPNAQNSLLQFNRAVGEAIGEEAGRVGELTEEIQQNENLTEQQRDALTEPLAQAQETLGEPDVSQAETVAALSEAESELRELAGSLNQSTLQAALEAAAGALAGSEAGAALGEAFAAGDLAAAAEATGQLAEQASELDSASQSALAEQIDEAAAALAGSEPELAETLQEAAEALQEGNAEAAADALRETAATLEERASRQAAAAQAETTATQLQNARQAVAQAGSDTPQDTGAAGAEAATGSSQTAQGASGEGAGTGPPGSETAAGQQSGSASSNQESGSGSQGGGRSENVFVPSPLDLSGEAGSEFELPVACLTDPANCGPRDDETDGERQEAQRPEGSTVPYQDVFGDYSEAAFEALDSEYIPLGLQDLVRDYFSSLAP